MRYVLAAAVLALSGCTGLLSNPKVTTDAGLGVACIGEVQAAAPACIAEVPSCVAVGKALSGKK